MSAPWAEREPDEPVLDWMLRLQLSQMAMDGRIRVPETERTAAS